MLPLLSFDEFDFYMKQIKAYMEFECDLYKLVEKYNKNMKIGGMQYDYAEMKLPYTPLNVSIKLLERLMYNKYETVDYFIWELEFGKEWTPGRVTDKEGNDVRLSTIRELYDFLIIEARDWEEDKCEEKEELQEDY